MKHYIDKSALVAEIEKRKERCDTFYDIALSNNAEFAKVAIEEQKRQYNSLLSFLNILEVKGVDLEKEIKDYFKNQLIIARSKGIDYQFIPSGEEIAKHFFELGLRARKGE